MPTPAFGPVLEAALKDDVQGGKFTLLLGKVINPQFFCCVSGTNVGVRKDPAAHLSVSPTQVCENVAVTATYSGSWSGSSTIASWTVDWGDGQTSNGAWPGAGSIAHPLGGYILAGTYTVTLTVTDLLGATGEASSTVEVLACDELEIGLLGGCGASGPWYTANAGVDWAEIGGGIIDGALIYDIKPHWLASSDSFIELWAATEQGLYRGEYDLDTLEIAWEGITLSQPDDWAGNVTAYAITPSKYTEDEVYVLAADNPTNQVWLYRTEDKGDTWTEIGIGPLEWQDMDPWDDLAGTPGTISSLQWRPTTRSMYIGSLFGELPTVAMPCGVGECNHFAYYDTTTNTWYNPGSGIGPGLEDLAMSPGNVIHIAGQFDAQGANPAFNTASWNGANYTVYPAHPGCCWQTYSVEHHIGSPWWSTLVGMFYWELGAWVAAGVNNGFVLALRTDGDTWIYAGGTFTSIDGSTIYRLARRLHGAGESWQEVGDGVQNDSASSSFYVRDIAVTSAGDLIVVGNFTLVGDDTACVDVARWNGSDWYAMGTGDDALNGAVRCVVIADDGTIYVGGSFTATVGGTTLNRVARWDPYAETWRQVGAGFNSEVFDLEFDVFGNLWACGQMTATGGNPLNYVARVEPGGATLPTVGRTHLIDMDADGQYVYISILDGSSNPVIMRAAYDLSTVTELYDPGAGSWGGVACDPYFPGKVWIFGDFGASNKVRLSEDRGESWTDVTDAGWAAGELVRPLLISDWATEDIIVVLNVALECHQTKDDGTTWANNGAVNFAAQCGARDPWEPQNLWLGRTASNATHLQLSVDEGINWQEVSGGFSSPSPVTALAVIA